MTILWLNWRDIKNPKAGGAEVMMHETAKRLARDGHQITIISSYFPGAKKLEIIDGIKIIRQGNGFTCPFWAFLKYKKEFEGKIDLVIDGINTIPFFTNFYIKEKKIALIHQLAREYWWSEIFFPLNLVGYLLEPLYLKTYRNIPTIAASNSTKKDLTRLGFGKVFVFHQGLSTKPLSRLPQKRAPSVLFVGRLTRTKGPQNAIVAFKEIHKVIPKSKLTIVGGGQPKFMRSLETLVRKLKLTRSITLLGIVPQKTKINLYKSAKIVLIPSVREGWNLVPIEANCFGAVPVGYNVPGLRDSIKNGRTGVLTEKNTPQNLAANAITILSNEKIYGGLASGGLAWSKNFNWDKTYNSFYRILSKSF